MLLNLDIADDLYFLTRIHFACLCRGMTKRIWVIHEFIARLKSIIVKRNLMADGQDVTDVILPVGQQIKSGDAACTIFVVCDGLTNLCGDVLKGDSDRLGAATASYPEDKESILHRTDETIGIKAANFAINVIGHAAIVRRLELNPSDHDARTCVRNWASGGQLHSAVDCCFVAGVKRLI
jgi:hypothetical protein